MSQLQNKWKISSRIHKLNHFPDKGVACYVKRDDELACGISGSKMRKYASLMPYLESQGIGHLVIIAGHQSNNLLAALQVAREFQLEVTAFLIQARNLLPQGNYKLSRLFLDDKEIVWVAREDWPKVEVLANEYIKTLPKPGFLLSEGASVAAAMPGAMSIARDILANEEEAGLQFQHIFVDAGTGFSAAALIKGLDELNHPAEIHVLLLADHESLFKAKLEHWTGKTARTIHCFYPDTAKSFGAVNQKIKQEIRRLAREEGLLADPVYSAKLFYSARAYIKEKALKGAVLIIHSGGALSLAGQDL